ncbi:MAG: TonB-dependent receptor [Bacteroidota bacterium]|nr:TonB-dependent receptor [Bacteroidota bacterium]MDX5506843.1 TonB-dependent receptor [Bacteroidota bacterium]
MNKWLTFIFLLLSISAISQTLIEGRIVDEKGDPLPSAIVLEKANGQTHMADPDGKVRWSTTSPLPIELEVRALGYRVESFTLNAFRPFVIRMIPKNVELGTVEVKDRKEGQMSSFRLRNIEGTAVYAGKKTELIRPDDLPSNLAANNARQIFSRIPGLNIWESDDGGIQLGVGARGLNPNRTSEFNTRVNGYDLSADALGYPETYYTPAAESLERIEVVRGAASLQYGTQFGGMINFVHKTGPEDQPFEFTTRNSIGSYGFFNTFNSLGGHKGGLRYYGYAQYKKGDGWRPNSEYEYRDIYGSVSYEVGPRLKLGLDITSMAYLAHQPGGLTDRQFEEDPTQSFRSRNWFRVNWNILAFHLDLDMNESTHLNSRTFGLFAGRDALGLLSRINRIDDPSLPRDLIMDEYANVGNETRLLHRYQISEQPQALLTGVRIYRGNLHRQQGLAPNGEEPEFSFQNPDRLEGSDYRFPSTNLAWFTENVFHLSERWTLTPGIRFEFIDTRSDGYYRLIQTDQAGNILVDEVVDDSREDQRTIFLAGIGMGYHPVEFAELYFNFSQNYRAINFNDMRVVNPNQKVDPDLQDERGFNLDIGFRGNWKGWVDWDVSGFLLHYGNRIGTILKVDEELQIPIRYRTNVASSYSAGMEIFAEADLWKLIKEEKTANSLRLFTNVAVIRARYYDSEESAFEGNQVEWVPPLNIKTGLTFGRGGFHVQGLFTFVSEHFTDATNAVYDPYAVSGIIPTYWVSDVSMGFEWKVWTIEASCNNVTNNSYFTRRAAGYPGPGIIPANPRTFTLTLGLTL